MKIPFSISKHGHTLHDTIVLPDDHKLTQKQIDALKQARFDAWYLLITTPVENPNPEEPEVDNG